MVSSAMPADLPYADIFWRVSLEEGVPWFLLAAIAKHESNFDALATNGNAVGLMQVTPVAAEQVKAVGNLYDPYTNVQTAARYLKWLDDTLTEWGCEGIDCLLAAYCWGPREVKTKPLEYLWPMRVRYHVARIIMDTCKYWWQWGNHGQSA